MAKLENIDIRKDERYFISQIIYGKKIIFTEGPSDKKVIEDYYLGSSCKKCSIIHVDLIEFNNENLRQKGYEDNNRDRVRYICDVLLNKEQMEGSYLGIIDRDFDRLDNVNCKIQRLEYTDFANMEMYFYSFENIKRVIQLNYGELKNIETTLDEMQNILQEFFLIRSYNREKNLTRVDFKKNARWISKQERFDWDRNKYLNKLLGNNIDKCQDASMYIDVKLKEIAADDVRYHIHGHDFIDLLNNLVHNNGTNDKLINQLILQYDKNKYEEFNLFNIIKEIS